MQASDFNIQEWGRPVWDSLLGRGLERLPHALLLCGPEGIGKVAFAEALAALLLCENKGGKLAACGACQSCRWLLGANHPDYRRVAAEGDDEDEGSEKKADKKKASVVIKIDQIRALEDFVFVGSHRHGNRVVLVDGAEGMNLAAANALLKILEEPPAGVYFILVSSHPRSLLPTIRSRCRVVTFGRPDAAQATAWLKAQGLDKKADRYLDLAAGAPLRVMRWNEQKQLPPIDALIDSLIQAPNDPIALAGRWDALLKANVDFRLEHLVEGLQRWMFDLSQESLGGETTYHRGWARPKPGKPLDPQALIAGYRDLLPFRRSARHPLNQLLFLESLAAHFLRVLKPLPQ